MRDTSPPARTPYRRPDPGDGGTLPSTGGAPAPASPCDAPATAVAPPAADRRQRDGGADHHRGRQRLRLRQLAIRADPHQAPDRPAPPRARAAEEAAVGKAPSPCSSSAATAGPPSTQHAGQQPSSAARRASAVSAPTPSSWSGSCPKTRQLMMLSIPRDLWGPIPGQGSNRINSRLRHRRQPADPDHPAGSRHPDQPLRRGQLRHVPRHHQRRRRGQLLLPDAGQGHLLDARHSRARLLQPDGRPGAGLRAVPPLRVLPGRLLAFRGRE